MEDLRKDYNVQKNKRSINLNNWWRSNNSFFKLLLLLGIITLIILRPDLIGLYTGIWFNNLYTSFTNNVTITSSDWYLILITISTFLILYKILNTNLNAKR